MAQMGIGELGSPGLIIKRKFRWTFELTTPCGYVPPHFCKSSGRPNLDIEETELNFLNATSWIPGKGKWQPITVTYLDAVTDKMSGLYSWIATVYNFTDPVGLQQSEKSGWAGTGLLSMYDGCGTLLETWEMQRVFPTAINFGDVAYDSSDIATIELTLRYSDVSYRSYCPNFVPVGCCTGCSA